MRMRPCALLVLLCSYVSAFGCASVDRDLYFGGSAVAPRLLPVDTFVVVLTMPEPGSNNVYLKSQGELEARYLLLNDLARNVVQEGGEKRGYVVCQIRASQSVNIAWAIPSGISLLTLNLLGLPVGSSTSDVRLDMEVRDLNHNVLRIYSSDATATDYAAMYWGKGLRGLHQSSLARAMRAALEKTKAMVTPEIASLNARLSVQ